MKKILSYLVIALFILFPFNINASSNYEISIIDDAEILSEEEEAKLEDIMTPLLEYGNISLVTDKSSYTSTASKASDYYHGKYGTESGTVLYIDMANRYIYIFSEGSNSHIITDSKAEIITDNTYTYASKGDYFGCSKEAFNQMNIILSGGKIAEPMRIISAALLSLLSSLLICFLYVFFCSKKKSPSIRDLIKSCDIKFKLLSFDAKITGERKVYNPETSYDGSSGGSSGGGGGGGSSGSGGGHRF